MKFAGNSPCYWVVVLLVLTHSADATADYLCGRLRDEQVDFTRLDTDYVPALVKIEFSNVTTLHVARKSLVPRDISNVWLRRPQPISHCVGTDPAEQRHTNAEWSEAIEGFLSQVPIARWMNHPTRNVNASHKIEQLVRASQFGLRIPDTIVTQSGSSLRAFWEKHAGNLIVKPLASGFLERAKPEDDTNIYTNRVRVDDMEFADRVASCPTLCQELISKLSDVRATIVDGSIHAVSMIRSEDGGRQRLDIRRDNMRDVAYAPITLPQGVRDSLLALVDSYGLRFAAVDFGIDSNGQWNFFEINPNGQWAWLDLAGATSIADSFISSFKQ